jgi:hypothetical protein
LTLRRRWIHWIAVVSPKKRAPKPKTESKTEPDRRKEVRKEESMRIRVSKPDKDVLERAAARVGLGVSAFVLSAALERARAALGE